MFINGVISPEFSYMSAYFELYIIWQVQKVYQCHVATNCVQFLSYYKFNKWKLVVALLVNNISFNTSWKIILNPEIKIPHKHLYADF